MPRDRAHPEPLTYRARRNRRTVLLTRSEGGTRGHVPTGEPSACVKLLRESDCCRGCLYPLATTEGRPVAVATNVRCVLGALVPHEIDPRVPDATRHAVRRLARIIHRPELCDGLSRQLVG